MAVVSEPKWYVTSDFFRSNCNYKQERLNELANVMNTHPSFCCFCCSNPNVEVEVKGKSDFIIKSLPFSSRFRLFPLNIQHALWTCISSMQIFLLHGCYVRVLNEKYIQAQQKNNNNRTNPVTHIHIFYLSSLQLIEFGEEGRERDAQERKKQKKKSRGENNKGEKMVFLFLNDTSRHFSSSSSSSSSATMCHYLSCLLSYSL